VTDDDERAHFDDPAVSNGPTERRVGGMDDRDLLANINALVDEEHRLRAHAAGGHGLADDEQARLRRLEDQLDRCWDLLRQRRARAEFGQDPDEATERSPGQVEGYLQ
jgi:Protein of unknown function (DUF2630)